MKEAHYCFKLRMNKRRLSKSSGTVKIKIQDIILRGFFKVRTTSLEK